MDQEDRVQIRRRDHVRFFKRFLSLMPQDSSSLDSQRVTILFFALSGIDILNSMDSIDSATKRSMIRWIYSLQIQNDRDNISGFQGSSTFNSIPGDHLFKCGYIAHTYTALCSLLILGDDLSGVYRRSIIKCLRALQKPDGSYIAILEGSENDMRFVYCAACICYILDNWEGMDIDRTVNFILCSISYDYGIGQYPGTESHGGSTFCAIATLALANRLHCLSPVQRRGVIRWLVLRQEGGFQGRPNKPVDTCYSFWIGAALKILNAFHLTNFEDNRNYVMSTQDYITGGFSKWPGNSADPLHTYFGICGLSLIGERGFATMMPSLNISYRTSKRLEAIHARWKGRHALQRNS